MGRERQNATKDPVERLTLFSTDTIKFSPAREEGWLPANTSRWAGRLFLAAVLLSWVRMIRMKMSAIRVGPPGEGKEQTSTCRLHFFLLLRSHNLTDLTHFAKQLGLAAACLTAKQNSKPIAEHS